MAARIAPRCSLSSGCSSFGLFRFGSGLRYFLTFVPAWDLVVRPGISLRVYRPWRSDLPKSPENAGKSWGESVLEGRKIFPENSVDRITTMRENEKRPVVAQNRPDETRRPSLLCTRQHKSSNGLNCLQQDCEGRIPSETSQAIFKQMEKLSW
jgi:hypothetical protein